MFKKNAKFLISIITFILFFFTFYQFSSWYENKLIIEENKTIRSELKAHSTSIRESINKRFILLGLLKSYISQNIDSQNIFDINNVELNNYAKTLFNSVEGVRAFQVSPNGIHTFVYPLIGNEKTLYKNLFKDKRVEVIKMLKVTKNSKNIIANAPYKLTQGGFGLVTRQSIKHNGKFWGFVVMVLDMSYILEKAGFTDKQVQLDIAIFQDKKHIFGNKDILSSNYQSAQLIIANQKLTIFAKKKESLYSTTIFFINLFIFFISILCTFIIYTLLNKAKKQDEILTSVFQVLPDLLFIMKKDGTIVDYRAQINNDLYVDDEVFLNKKMQDVLPDNVGKMFNEKIQMLSNNNDLITFKYSLEISRKIKHYEARMVKLPIGEYIMTIVRDITELKSKDEMLINQSRYAAMGEMIGMIAHQWRQPLSVISMNANNMLADIALDGFSITEAEKYANSINKQAQHLSSTIDDFRNFFKPDKVISKVNIRETIDGTFSIVKDSLKNNSIEVTTSFETDKEVNAYPRELMQVFVNIINNSKDVLISHKTENALINIRVYEDEKYINTEVCDNGGGIDDDLLPKIFEPYFSTKDVKSGTGLGLYMSKMIIENHLNGSIEVCNKDEGACLTVRLLKEQIENG